MLGSTLILKKGAVALIRYIFFYFDTSEHLDPLLLRTKFQQHKQSYSGEKDCLNGFNIFSISVVSF